MLTVEKGFTLLELVLTLFLSVILMYLIFSVFFVTSNSASLVKESASLQECARGMLNILLSDIRRAGSVPNCPDNNCCSAIVQADDSSLSIKFDINGDNDCDDPGEYIKYYVNNSTLFRQDVNSSDTEIIIGNFYSLDCFKFFYILDDGTEISNPTDLFRIKSIKFKAVIKTNTKILKFHDTNNYQICGPFNDNYLREYIEGLASIRSRSI